MRDACANPWSILRKFIEESTAALQEIKTELGVVFSRGEERWRLEMAICAVYKIYTDFTLYRRLLLNSI